MQRTHQSKYHRERGRQQGTGATWQGAEGNEAQAVTQHLNAQSASLFAMCMLFSAPDANVLTDAVCTLTYRYCSIYLFIWCHCLNTEGMLCLHRCAHPTDIVFASAPGVVHVTRSRVESTPPCRQTFGARWRDAPMSSTLRVNVGPVCVSLRRSGACVPEMDIGRSHAINEQT